MNGSSLYIEQHYQEFFTGLLTGNRQRCAEIVQDIIQKGTHIKNVYTDLFQRALYEIGELWERGKISVAVEHLATAIVERLIILVQPKVIQVPQRPYTSVISCITDEFHELGARMVADIFELHGWHTHFLGANTPLKDLLSLIRHQKPQVVGLSLSIYFNIAHFLHTYTAIRSEYPKQFILYGGQAFRWGTLEALSTDPNALYIPSLHELEQFLLSYESSR